jgi:hypothetical protein
LLFERQNPPVGITKWASPGILIGIVLLLISCDGFFPSQSKPDVPADHNRKISGVLHKSGLNEPLDPGHGCITAVCHGDSLRGGVAVSDGRQVVAPSCYQCHGAVWEGGDDDEEEGGEDDD